MEYISTLDADRDLLILRSHGLHVRRECERVLRVCTMILKKCATKGLTPKQIGQVYFPRYATIDPVGHFLWYFTFYFSMHLI